MMGLRGFAKKTRGKFVSSGSIILIFSYHDHDVKVKSECVQETRGETCVYVTSNGYTK